MLRCNVIVADPGERALLGKRLEFYASRTGDLNFICSGTPVDEFGADCYTCDSNLIAEIIEPLNRPPRWLPIIAYGRAGEIRNAYLAGCADFMKVPWTPEELHFRSLKCSPIRRHHFPFGHIELTGSSLTVWFGDRHLVQIDINKQQIAILKALLALRGSIVSRDLLYFAMWGRYGGESRALDMQIHGLRAALGKVDESLGNKALIRGAYGSGYLIV